MLLSLRKNGPTSLFKEVRVFKVLNYGRGLSKATFIVFLKPQPLKHSAFPCYNLFLIELVRISGFSSLFSAIAVFLAHSARER